MGSGQDHRRRARPAARARVQRLSSDQPLTRQVEVAPERVTGWVERYAASHPGTRATVRDGSVVLGAEGSAATATLTPLVPLTQAVVDPSLDGLVAALVAHAAQERVVALVLIRRGGFAVGVARGPKLVASKVGTRYVQSRTAAGGWSQQRFARRRDGQARELLDAAAAAWVGLHLSPDLTSHLLVTGGDRALCERLLEDRRLPDLLPVRHIDVPDPRAVVLAEAARRARAVQVVVQEPTGA